MDSQTEPQTKPVKKDRKEHRSHPRLFVFLVCFIISVLMWLYVELMKTYNDEITYTVTFTEVPKNLILTNGEDSTITVGMNAQGFELLAAKYANSRRTVNINLSRLKIRPSGNGYVAFLPSARVIDQLGSQIRFDKELRYIKPDTLFFRFSEIHQKQVPVIPDIDYSLNKQYDLIDTITFKPRFVTVSSIKNIIDTLSFVKTERLSLNQLDSSISIRVALSKGDQARLIRYSSDSVTVNLKIAKVTEASFIVPVSISGNGENVKIFPDKVEIICSVPLSEFASIKKSDFMAQVEYHPSMKSENKLKVTLLQTPPKVKILKVIPEEVEYIIISK